MAPRPKFSISLDPAAAREIALRADPAAAERSGAISENLNRYFSALERARRSLRSRFSAGECSAILDVCNGSIYEAHSMTWLHVSVQDALDDGIAEKWSIDGAALVEKLRDLTYIEACAVVDAAERAWRTMPADGKLNAAALLD